LYNYKYSWCIVPPYDQELLMDQAPPARAVRLRLQSFFPVYDQDSLQQLGRMVDLSVSGMMVIAREELPVGKTFEIEIRTPEDHSVPPLRLAAETVWCRLSPNNNQHFGVGFRFCSVAGDVAPLLEQLMQEAGTLH
jgi:hypothetical protein